jgi:hypothetical protein
MTMLNRTDISNELKVISPAVEKLPFTPVFTVPDGYFTHFPQFLMEKIKNVENDTVAAELESISPLLAGSLTKKMPYSLPEGYFSTSNPALQPPREERVAPVVPMFPVKKSRMLYAAAAVVAFLGIFTLLYKLNTGSQPLDANVNITAELPKVDAREINAYLLYAPEDVQTEPLSLANLEDIDFEGVINDINDKELKEFLTENPSLKIETLN